MDFNKPIASNTESDILGELLGGRQDQARMFDPAIVTDPTNKPTGTIRWNNASLQWQRWTGSSWVALGTLAHSISGNAATANTATNVSGGTASVTSITNSGNLSFTGTGNRITADFSNATVANRVLFQTSATNSPTTVAAIPNGTDPTAVFAAVSGSDPTNASTMNLLATSTEGSLRASRFGSGTFLPMTFYTGGSERVRIDTSGNVGIGATPTASTSARLFSAGDTTLVGSAKAFLFNMYYHATNLRWEYAANAPAHGWVDVGSGSVAYLSTGNVSGAAGTTASVNERLRIGSSGDVGIGTASIGARVDIVRSGALGLRVAALDNSGYGYVGFGRSATASNNWHIGSEGDGTFRIYNGNLWTGSECMRIGSSGQLGIGGANYGTTNQVIKSQGASSAPVWAAISDSDILDGRTWQTVTRTSGTSYTNTTGRTIHVSVSWTQSGGGANVVVGGVTISSVSNSNLTSAFSFPVPNGVTYTITAGAGLSVAELR